jgi:hypothetical protein
MARGGQTGKEQKVLMESTHDADTSPVSKPVVNPLHVPAEPVLDKWGNELHFLGFVALDEIGSSQAQDEQQRQQRWDDIKAAFPGGQQTSGDMFMHFWDDPQIVVQLRRYMQGKPFRMIVACGFQSVMPTEPRFIYRASSLGHMLDHNETALKARGGEVIWAGSPELTQALEAGDDSWAEDFSVNEDSELWKYALAYELALARSEIEPLREELDGASDLRQMMIDDFAHELKSFDEGVEDDRKRLEHLEQRERRYIASDQMEQMVREQREFQDRMTYEVYDELRERKRQRREAEGRSQSAAEAAREGMNEVRRRSDA